MHERVVMAKCAFFIIFIYHERVFPPRLAPFSITHKRSTMFKTARGAGICAFLLRFQPVNSSLCSNVVNFVPSRPVAASVRSFHHFFFRRVLPSPLKCCFLSLGCSASPSFFLSGLISYPKKSFPGGSRRGCGPARFFVDFIPGIETVPTGVDDPGVDDAVEEDAALPFFATSLLPPPEKFDETLAAEDGAMEE